MTPEANALFCKLEDINPLAFKDQRQVALALIAHALAEARREGLMEGATVVNGLMGKDSGNWNRAIIYAEAAIRAKAQEGGQ